MQPVEEAKGVVEFWSHPREDTWPINVIVRDGVPKALVWNPDSYSDQDYRQAMDYVVNAGYPYVARTDIDTETGLQVDVLSDDIERAH